jgi:hypothetical protein
VNKLINLQAGKPISYILLAAALLTVLAGIYQFYSKEKFLRSCRLIKCRVTHIEEKEGRTAEYTFNDVNRVYPQFTYNKNIDDNSHSKEYELNKIYDIYYYPKDPLLSEPKDFQTNYKTSLIIFSIGLIFIINISISHIVKIFKKVKERKRNGKGSINIKH